MILLDAIMLLDLFLCCAAGVVSLKVFFALRWSLFGADEFVFDFSCGAIGGFWGAFLGVLFIFFPTVPNGNLIVAAVPVTFITVPVILVALYFVLSGFRT